MNIGSAVEALKQGEKVRRRGWNGMGMFLVYVKGGLTTLKPDTPYARALDEAGFPVEICSHIDMFTTQGAFQPGWLASQADLLAEDWELA